MAKKLIQLSAIDIILQADAETIREAYESRVKIDELLLKRMEAYQQIEEIEQQVEGLVGEDGTFVYPAPSLPVAGFSKLVPVARTTPPKPKVVEDVVESDDVTSEVNDLDADSEEESN